MPNWDDEKTTWEKLREKKPELAELFRKITCWPAEINYTDEVTSTLSDAIIDAYKHQDFIKPSPIFSELDNFIKDLWKFPSSQKIGEITISDLIEKLERAKKSREDYERDCRYSFANYKGETLRRLTEACWDFVDYQLNSGDVCASDAELFKREGFQIGSAWHGDILKAPVLFLSFNPGITQGCVFPRWHPDKNLFTWCGLRKEDSGDYTGNYTIEYDGIQKINVIQDVKKIYKYLRDRLIDTYIDDSGKIYIWEKKQFDRNNKILTCQKGSKPIKFWNELLVDMMNLLIGSTEQSREHTQRLMRSVLSAEIIFWGSKNGEGAQDEERLKYFWENFTAPIIKHCGADLLYLVGEKTIDTFNIITRENLKSGDVISDGRFTSKLGKRYEAIAAIDHPSKRGKTNYRSVVSDLNGKIPQTIADIQTLYNLA